MGTAGHKLLFPARTEVHQYRAYIGFIHQTTQKLGNGVEGDASERRSVSNQNGMREPRESDKEIIYTEDREQRGRQTDRQLLASQTERQTERQTESQTDTHRQRQGAHGESA